MRSQTVVIEPPASFISLAEAKAHLRIDDCDNDAEVQGFVAAAIATIDGPDGWLGRALGLQTLELRLPAFLPGPYGSGGDVGYGPGAGPEGFYGACDDVFADYLGAQAIKLLCPPVQAITSIAYLDTTGTLQVLDPSAYYLADRMVLPVYGTTWPVTRLQPASVVIRYQAGYTTPASPGSGNLPTLPAGQVPAPIRAAVKLMLGTLYEGRECGAAAGFSGAIGNLLSTYRVIDR